MQRELGLVQRENCKHWHGFAEKTLYAMLHQNINANSMHHATQFFLHNATVASGLYVAVQCTFLRIEEKKSSFTLNVFS